MTALSIIKFGSDRINTVGGVAFDFSSRIWSCVNKNFKYSIAKKSQPIFPHNQHSYSEVCLKSDENWASRLLRIVTLEILQSTPNDPKPNSRNRASKSTLHMCTVVPRVPNFCSFCSMISRFQDIAHFGIFPLTPMLKIQSAIYIFLILAGRQSICNFIFPYNCLIYHKVWLRSDKNCREGQRFEISSPIWSKNFKVL